MSLKNLYDVQKQLGIIHIHHTTPCGLEAQQFMRSFERRELEIGDFDTDFKSD